MAGGRRKDQPLLMTQLRNHRNSELRLMVPVGRPSLVITTRWIETRQRNS